MIAYPQFGKKVGGCVVWDGGHARCIGAELFGGAVPHLLVGVHGSEIGDRKRKNVIFRDDGDDGFRFPFGKPRIA